MRTGRDYIFLHKIQKINSQINENEIILRDFIC